MASCLLQACYLFCAQPLILKLVVWQEIINELFQLWICYLFLALIGLVSHPDQISEMGAMLMVSIFAMVAINSLLPFYTFTRILKLTCRKYFRKRSCRVLARNAISSNKKNWKYKAKLLKSLKQAGSTISMGESIILTTSSDEESNDGVLLSS